MSLSSDPFQTYLDPQATSEHAGSAASLPSQIGRFRVERVLGQGSFGVVYLAHDDQLQRLVAIKVPHPQLVARSSDAEAYLTEARMVANLDHPLIVSVFDVGSTEQFPCFVVSKYIDGTDLAQRLQEAPLSLNESVQLVAQVAEALHYAHQQMLVHRDIKPGNILLDRSGKPFVADFGLALREQDVGKGPRFAGTPAYMSPEQARGEGHRVDGRSDVFSLGVVLYELLTRRRPFKADTLNELMDQVSNVEARPLRQIDEAIPKELERICFKALAKRASERYMTAQDMAEDLRLFLVESPGVGLSTSRGKPPNTTGVESAVIPATMRQSTDSQLVRIVPKGLRSFDAHDADFFLELLPGPQDRNGLPDSLRFWKTRIEETDPDHTFAVGLIYGPSGCGKSSLVKAGLLPRLSADVLPVYIEATPDETEARLLQGLRKRCPALDDSLNLKETLTALRRGQGIPYGKKVLIVLDQFEQWLHAKHDEQAAELIQALRQCDGGRVQCIVMVRDDFWLAVSRFLRDLEIRLVDGQNGALVDLFDLDHARKVLAAFGRAFGKLPENSGETSRDQREFLKQAVSGLAQDGKVICVRLALFAEMMKGKSWTPAALKEVGGTEGVGVTFLEETFSAATAPPEHRYHQKAARAKLRALLPETGSNIKGHMRSYAELLEASGYGSRPKDFDDLIRILDNEIRLITPTDPEGKDDAESTAVKAGTRYYQLTHDYLVHSLRDWLTRKQKETRRGRAELLLADRAAVWNSRPETRQLPSLIQWLQIKWFTENKHWTPTQRKMMARAGRYHATRSMIVAIVLTVLGWGAYETRAAMKADALQARLLDANPADVPIIVNEMTSFRRWINPRLRTALLEAMSKNDVRDQLHVSLALLPVDTSQVAYLYGRLLDAQVQEVPVIRDALAPHQDSLSEKLWAVVLSPERGNESRRLRAAAALAKYAPEDPRWMQISSPVVNDLVRENPVYLGQWSEAFRPVRKALIVPLTVIFRDPVSERAAERSLATNLLADYAADQPQVLADLIMDADFSQFTIIYPRFKETGAAGLSLLTGELDRKLPSDAPDELKESMAKRTANVAVALLRMNQPAKVWPLLKHSRDPRVRSYLIHRLHPFGVDAEVLIQRLEQESDITIRRALLLSLGEYRETDLSQETRETLLPKLQDAYRNETDSGLHAAAEWLLRQWKQEAWLKQVNDEWATNKDQRDKQLDSIQRTLMNDKVMPSPQWYVTGQGQTMVVIPGPVEFTMGSPPTEAGRIPGDETQQRMRINRTFAVSAKDVTLEQHHKFENKFQLPAEYHRVPDLPAIGISWYMAVKYCNWLSEQEGIPADQHCYEFNANEGYPLLEANYLKPNYLSLTGYRLPTRAEMEYVTRAEATTSRYFGETAELLPNYAWYLQNSDEKTWPVGSLKPNDCGFFDAHGNVRNWCQESTLLTYPEEGGVRSDKEDGTLVLGVKSRRCVGSSFSDKSSFVRSANTGLVVPTNRNDFTGIRVARTLPVQTR